MLVKKKKDSFCGYFSLDTNGQPVQRWPMQAHAVITIHQLLDLLEAHGYTPEQRAAIYEAIPPYAGTVKLFNGLRGPVLVRM